MIGEIISHYKILDKLGEGGMGVVYKAEDFKLKRIVALKFLPSNALGTEKEKGRFIREAQTAASLNHPNIATIYEIDEVEGEIFIAMEYIDGQTLKKKVDSGPLKIKEAVKIACQVADGLHAAHEKGITHRDIKSANVMLTKKGQAKIMDFGLAKLKDEVRSSKSGIAGTIAYMAPEQLQGFEVDTRTDIWSFGVVMYEMLMGQLPFKGEYESAMMYSIVSTNPEPMSDVPSELERIVNKSLAKNPEERYQHVDELPVDLKAIETVSKTISGVQLPTTTATGVGVGTSRRRMIRVVIVTLIAVIVALFGIVFNLMIKSPSPPLRDLITFTSVGRLASSPSWNTDDTWIAYASDEAEKGNMDIWKKQVGGGKIKQLTETPYNESQPAWSPDERTIAYFSDREGGGIFEIPSDGGTPERLTEFGTNPTWSPDNENLAFNWHGNIYVRPYPHGDRRLLVSGTSSTPFMVWTPDGEKLIFWNRMKGDIYSVSVNDETLEPLELIPSGEEVSGLTLSSDGKQLVFSRGPFGGNKNLWAVAIDPNTCKTVGKPSQLLLTTTDNIQCAFSTDGSKLAFTDRQLERQLYKFSINPATGLTTGEKEQITFKGKQNYYPAFSPDGQIFVWTSHQAGQGLLYSKGLEKKEEIKVTHDWGQSLREIGGSFAPDGLRICYASTLQGSYQIWYISSIGSVGSYLTKTQHPFRDASPVWSPTGETIAFYSNHSGNWDIWSVQATGRSEPVPLTSWESNELYPTWSPDGLKIAFTIDKEGNSDIWLMDSNGGNPQPYIKHSAEECWSAWSPDGQWFYFTSDRSGVFNIWVKSVKRGEVSQVTPFQELDFGLPEVSLFTKFAVSSSILIVPLETRKGDIYILENMK